MMKPGTLKGTDAAHPLTNPPRALEKRVYQAVAASTPTRRRVEGRVRPSGAQPPKVAKNKNPKTGTCPERHRRTAGASKKALYQYKAMVKRIKAFNF